MAYFNHAFQKTIVGTQGVFSSGKVWEMKDAGAGKVAFFGAKGTNKDASLMGGTSSEVFYIAGSTIRPNDFIGKMAGGYQEANKSKEINPKFVNRIYRVNHSFPSPAYLEIGNTSAENESCARAYNCGTTYYLRVDVKGGAVMSTLRHNAYSNVPAFVSCCDIDPTESLGNDGVLVYYEWAKGIKGNNIFDQFVIPVLVAKESGEYVYYAANATDAEIFANAGIYDVEASEVKTFAEFEAAYGADSPAYSADKAGLVLVAAYEETKFGNCTFQNIDGYNIEPLSLYASEVDSEGDMCFNGVCIKPTYGSKGQQGQGYGESVIRRVILDESYHQRFFPRDLRKREIEGADSIFSVIDRGGMYDSLYIIHSVPRFSNPSGIFDNDQYCVEVVGTDEVIDALVSRLSTLVPDVDVEVYGGVDDESTDTAVVKSVRPKSLTIAAGESASVYLTLDPVDSEATPSVSATGTGISAVVDSDNNKKVVVSVTAGTTPGTTGTVTIGDKEVAVTTE